MADRTQRVHIGFLDGIRGLSALYVVLGHVWQFAIAEQASTPAWFKAASVLKYGHFGVCVFIVISGYCLMLPVLREPGLALKGGLREFARRRARRILPPFYLALSLSILLIALVPVLRAESGTPWDITLPSFTLGKVLSHYFLFYNWSEAWHWAFNPPLWSVALELQIYVVFALVLLPLWRLGGPAAVLPTAILLGTAPVVAGFGFVNTWMLILFALGMTSAAIGHAGGSGFRRLRRLPWGAATVVLMVAVPLVTAGSSKFVPNPWQTMLQDLTVGAATALAVTALTLRQGARRGSVAAAVLETRPASLVGGCSYSLYLVHYPIVALVSLLFVHDLGLSAPVAFATLFAVCVPLSLAVAALFYITAERPFLNAQKPAKSAPEPELGPGTAADWITWTPKMHERLVHQTSLMHGRSPGYAWSAAPVQPPAARVPGPAAPAPTPVRLVRTVKPPPPRPAGVPRRGALARRPRFES